MISSTPELPFEVHATVLYELAELGMWFVETADKRRFTVDGDTKCSVKLSAGLNVDALVNHEGYAIAITPSTSG